MSCLKDAACSFGCIEVAFRLPVGNVLYPSLVLRRVWGVDSLESFFYTL